MWHPWLIVFTVAETALIVVIAIAVHHFRTSRDDDQDVVSIGLVLLIFIGVIASMVWIFCIAETFRTGVL